MFTCGCRRRGLLSHLVVLFCRGLDPVDRMIIDIGAWSFGSKGGDGAEEVGEIRVSGILIRRILVSSYVPRLPVEVCRGIRLSSDCVRLLQQLVER